MYVSHENERLYLRNWDYNSCRILTYLAGIVENHGGRVKPTRAAIVSNRTLSETIADLNDRIDQLIAVQEEAPTEKRAEYIERLEKERAEYIGMLRDPVRVTHTSNITFILDDTYYYYQTDSNPFFDFYYNKTPIRSGKYSRDAALETDKKEWLYDCFFSFNASDADCVEAANLIFNMLCNAKNSVIIRDSRRQRVPNLYDGGYHYETIYAPERFEKINF